jgi:hypothetical protein
VDQRVEGSDKVCPEALDCKAATGRPSFQLLSNIRASRPKPPQAKVKALVDSSPYQQFFAVLIAANYVSNVIQSEISADQGSTADSTFNYLDLFFTLVSAPPPKIQTTQRTRTGRHSRMQPTRRRTYGQSYGSDACSR